MANERTNSTARLLIRLEKHATGELLEGEYADEMRYYCEKHAAWLRGKVGTTNGANEVRSMLEKWSNEGLFKGASQGRERTRLDSPDAANRAWVLIDMHRRLLPIRQMRDAIKVPAGANPETTKTGWFRLRTHQDLAEPPVTIKTTRLVVMRPIIHFLNGDKPNPGIKGQFRALFFDRARFVEECRRRREKDPTLSDTIRVYPAIDDEDFASTVPFTQHFDPVPEEKFLDGIDNAEFYSQERRRLLQFYNELKAGRDVSTDNVADDYFHEEEEGELFHKAPVRPISLLELAYTHLYRIREHLTHPDNDWIRQCSYRKCERFFFPWNVGRFYCSDNHRLAEHRERAKTAEETSKVQVKKVDGT